MDFGKLGGALLKAGAPMLKNLVENAVGGVGGKIAGSIVDALAESLGTANDPDAIADAIDRDPSGTAPIVQQIESQMVKTMDIGTGDLTNYVAMLREDQKAEGLLTRLWRPLFATMYVVMFAMQITTVLWLMWTDRLDLIVKIGEVTTYLTFMNVAALAVLGIQIWKRTEEKKSGL